MMKTGMEMTLTVSSNPPFIKLLKSQRYPLLHGCFLIPRSQSQRFSLTCSMEVPNEKPFRELRKIKTRVENFTRVLETFPDSVKEFPWRKAEDTMLQRLLLLGQKALKWSLIALFITSSFLDIVFSISRNRELMIPLGLFIGCTIADFLKETSQELFQGRKEEGLLIGVGSFFVLVKFISLYFSIQGRAFLSHVGNGGLMQVLWLAKKLQEAHADENEKRAQFSHPDASVADNLGDSDREYPQS
ncbi:uncharacterized protein LOC143854534 isoform X2 [Tasmannia lanceolata]|uniref:uncharacterized protein LOC143854534 isoform X2 n=1 Tax=Tasmannia lanceolata TaxID=3420 RepID=UPI004062DB44